MTIAGGIAAALFARERTGETVGRRRVAARRRAPGPTRCRSTSRCCTGGPPAPTRSPATRRAPTRWSAPTGPPTAAGSYLAMLQPGRYWADFCRHIDREDLIDRRAVRHHREADGATPRRRQTIVARGARPRGRSPNGSSAFAGMEGQWAAVQDAWEVGHDPQMRANGLIAEVARHRGRRPGAGRQPRAVRRDARADPRGPRSSPSTPTRSCARSASPTTS